MNDPTYTPEILVKQLERLRKKIRSVIISSIVMFVIVFGAIGLFIAGFFTMSPGSEKWALLPVLVGIAIGVLFGYYRGKEQAFLLAVQRESLSCLFVLEKRTRSE